MLYLIAANPFSRKFSYSKLKLIKNFFNRKHLKNLTILSESIEDFKNRLITTIEDNFKEQIRIISAGGDGTLNLIINTITNKMAKNITFGIIPLGTANIIAKEFNYPLNIEDCLNVIIDSPEREIALSKINNHYFLFTCGLGYDGLVTKEVSQELKKSLGSIAYITKGIRLLKNDSFQEFNFTTDKISNFSAKSIIVNRIQRYAINKKIFKNAYILSDYFIIAIFKEVSFKSFLNFFLGRKSRSFIFKKAKKIEFNLNIPIPVQIDGEYLDIIPKMIEITDKKLKFILP